MYKEQHTSIPLEALLPRKAITIATVLMTLFILWVGLRHLPVSPDQGVGWDQESASWRLEGQGLIMTGPGEIATRLKLPETISDPFDLSLKLIARPLKVPEFTIVAGITNGDEDTQLVIGQWSSWIIVLNGNDYQNAGRENRLAYQLDDGERETPVHVNLRVRRSLAQLWVNGKLIKEIAAADLQLPGQAQNWQLMIGNTLDGGHGWVGGLNQLELRMWRYSEQPGVREFLQDPVVLQYTATRPDEYNPLLLASSPVTLLATPAGRFPERLFLKPMRLDLLTHASFRKDLVLNLFGFGIPGLLWFLLLYSWLYLRPWIATVTAGGICVLISFFIEYIQSFIPGRNSHMHDLLLNSLGGIAGAIAGLALVGLLQFVLYRQHQNALFHSVQRWLAQILGQRFYRQRGA